MADEHKNERTIEDDSKTGEELLGAFKRTMEDIEDGLGKGEEMKCGVMLTTSNEPGDAPDLLSGRTTIIGKAQDISGMLANAFRHSPYFFLAAKIAVLETIKEKEGIDA